jgi:hypothetical protein
MRLIHRHQRLEAVPRRPRTAGQSDLATAVDRESRHLSMARFRGRDPGCCCGMLLLLLQSGPTDRLLVGYPIGVWILGDRDTPKGAVASGIRCDIRFHRLRQCPVIPRMSGDERQTSPNGHDDDRRDDVTPPPRARCADDDNDGGAGHSTDLSEGAQIVRLPASTNGRTDRRTDGRTFAVFVLFRLSRRVLDSR